ncbi:MAG: tRNA pseudouridine(55) synthase TruB [[Lactobacillus] timonensis]|jgi:tRNA pseudouridine55 synthase|uniref:tRNA pseudouridine(55) synthase TruB n=1 Tax=[Lactobacillus] timonensis TaxID=1970790 RepID=UPI0023558165|nr:tRNA pseudouridine(55) synthase TruB [[Lactobacillus] timonensis]MCI1925978.1 tRNA pseudouridine(55) synthase TruB [[Lactobacillus] timonensis]MCI1957304.1 tRNA pseudouridine(55) synthase TruB [[Lactobacillus] timonensis]MCI1970353.1 tRNA pseudouridine(55) synthase TruB [[Lactobacillus] timonensis]MCI2006498.1 tRNA pseudouridine(55) synthase TruB [[Lactobacillus] timonensis]
MDGIIALYKDRGMTSFACVNRLRHVLHEKRIGHAGTLDPNVDGVLPICIGKATKVVDFLHEQPKTYVGELLIGEATETEDLDGKVIAEKEVPAPITGDVLQKIMGEMTGKLTQIPPMYSAVRVQGKHLYEYARAGETVERPKRLVTISNFSLVSSSYDAQSRRQRVRFKVQCSKGTYVRTLAVDLAKRLGYPGVMSSLTRVASGGFTIDQTISLHDVDDLVANQMIGHYVLPMEVAFEDWQRIELTANQWRAVKNGGWLTINELPADSQKRVALFYNNEIKALYYHADKQHYKPLKMLAVN